MQALNNLLVVVGETEQARYVLEKADILARATGARLHVVQVIYEGVADLGAAAIDSTQELKSLILQAAESSLEDMLVDMRAKHPDLESATIWNPRQWEGVMHAADRAEADLVIKGASLHPRFGDIVRTPDDWNLLRQSEVPVMLVKPQAWVENPTLLCALDPFDDAHEALSMAVLREARALTEVLGGELVLVVAYPLFEPWVGQLGALRNYDELKHSIEDEIRTRVNRLVDQAGVDFDRLVADEGQPTQVIGRLVEETEAEMLVIGTHAREGVTGILLGNTSERLLHAVATDVVTVHGTAV
jgi:universal stress protein E